MRNVISLKEGILGSPIVINRANELRITLIDSGLDIFNNLSIRDKGES